MGAAKTKKPIDLGNAKIGKLILTFAIPSILSHLVASIYNIVDQIFIGQVIGTEGTAATQVAYMLVLFMTACYVLVSTGSASKFSLEQGEGESKEKQGKVVGNGFFWLIAIGIVLMIVVLCAKEPLLKVLGAGDNELVLDYACRYSWIIAIGMPFQMFAAGGAIIIRADGSPTYSMMTTLSGAILNIALDALFMMGFNMGIEGAALATIIGQMVSAVICFIYMFRFKTIKFKAKYMLPNGEATGQIFRLGLAAGLMQFAIMIVQTVMNNMLRSYGETDLVSSVDLANIPESYLAESATVEAAAVSYASATALAVAGVVAKVNSIFNATIYGIATSVQPVLGYNYGAKRYHRVLKTFLEVLVIALIVGLVAFTLFQVIPKPILHIFQSGDYLYDDFGTQYLRIFMGAVFLTAVPITVSNFFPSINMPIRGIIASISRQIIFQLPLILILPLFFGMDGVLYAGCSSDSAACLLCIILVLPTVIKLAKAPKDPDAPVIGENGEPVLATAAAGADGTTSATDNTTANVTDNVLYDADNSSLSTAPAGEPSEDPFADDSEVTPTAEEAPAEESWATSEPVEEHPLVAEEAAYAAFAESQEDEVPADEEPAAAETAEEAPVEEPAEDTVTEVPVAEESAEDESPAAEAVPADETPVDETAEDEADEDESEETEAEDDASLDAEDEEPVAAETEDGVPHKYDYSFLAKVIQSPDEMRERYAEVVNYFLSFKGTNTRVSWKQCGLSYGRTRVGILLFRGKTLNIALALDPAEFADSKYHGRNMGDRKKFEKTPMMLALTSGRKLTYTKHLINVMMERLGAEKGGKTADVSYKYQTTEELVEQGLAKDLGPVGGAAAPAADTPAESSEE